MQHSVAELSSCNEIVMLDRRFFCLIFIVNKNFHLTSQQNNQIKAKTITIHLNNIKWNASGKKRKRNERARETILKANAAKTRQSITLSAVPRSCYNKKETISRLHIHDFWSYCHLIYRFVVSLLFIVVALIVEASGTQ